MAEDVDYFVQPETGVVGAVPKDQSLKAMRAGYTPASDQQITEFKARKAAKVDPYGGVKAYGQALAEGVLPGLAGAVVANAPGAIIGSLAPLAPLAMEKIPSLTEIGRKVAPSLVEEESARIAEQKRLELAGEMSRFLTVPGLQQELGLRTQEAIKAEREARPGASLAGSISSFFVGPAVNKIFKSATTALVPEAAAKATLLADAKLAGAVDEVAQVNAANKAVRIAQGDLVAAQATGDAVRITAAERALENANLAKQASVDQASRLQMALSAESGRVPAELEPLLTDEVLTASKEAIKAGKRISAVQADRLLQATPFRPLSASNIVEKMQDATLTTPAVFSKVGTEISAAIESSALSRIRNLPGLSSRLAEIEARAAREADNLATGADKIVTAERLRKANENLATLETRQELVAKAIGLGLGRSAEMMLFGAQGIANETALGDPALVGESAMAHLGLDAVIGGGVGLLEATLPSTVRASVRAAKGTGRQLRDWFVRWFPEASADVTGASPEATRAIIEQRAALRGKNVEDLGRILEETTPRVAEPVSLTEPTVVAPVLRPELPLTPTNLNRAQAEFRLAFESDLKAMESSAMEANANIRKIESNKLIQDLVGARISDAVARSVPSTASAVEREAARSEIAGLVNGQYQEALNGLVSDVRGAIMAPTDPQASVVASRLSDFYDRISAFAASNPLPHEIHREVKLLKRELWDAGGNYKIAKNEMKLLPQKTQAALGELRNKFVQHLEDISLYDQAAVREQSYNRVYTRYINAIKNLKKDGLILYDWERGAMRNLRVNPDKVKSFVGKFADDSNALRREHLKDYLESRADLVDQIQESARYARANFDREAVADHISRTTLAYERAIDVAAAKVGNQAIKAINKDIAASNKEIVKVSAERAQEMRSAYENAVKAQMDEYKALVDQRRVDIKEQARLLKTGAKDNNYKMVLDLLGKGGVLGGVAAYAGGLPGAVGVIGAMRGYQSMLANPATVAKTLASLERAARSVEQQTMSIASQLAGTTVPSGYVAKTLIGAGTTGKGIAAWANKKALDKDYEESVKTLRKLSIDADARQDLLEDVLGDLEDNAPNINDAVKITNSTAIDYLSDRMPRPPLGLSPMRRAEWEPLEEDKRKFLRIKETVARPMDTLALATAGALLPEQVEALNTVYPALMRSVRDKLIAEIKKTGKIPAKQRSMVSMLLGNSVDGAPALGVTAQSVYGQQRQVDAQKQAQAQMPLSRAKALRLPERADYEGSARRNAQLK